MSKSFPECCNINTLKKLSAHLRNLRNVLLTKLSIQHLGQLIRDQESEIWGNRTETQRGFRCTTSTHMCFIYSLPKSKHTAVTANFDFILTENQTTDHHLSPSKGNLEGRSNLQLWLVIKIWHLISDVTNKDLYNTPTSYFYWNNSTASVKNTLKKSPPAPRKKPKTHISAKTVWNR